MSAGQGGGKGDVRVEKRGRGGQKEWRKELATGVTRSVLERAAAGYTEFDCNVATVSLEDEGHQVTLHGKTQPQIRVKAACGFSLEKPTGSPAQAKFVRAWKEVCRESLQRLDTLTAKVVAALAAEDKEHDNA